MPRRPALFLSTCIVLASMAAVALAADWIPLEQRLTPAQLHDTGLDALQPAQLALLNRLLREQTERVVEEARVDATRAAAAAPRAPRDPASLVGLSDQPIHARLVGDVDHWEPGTEFRLDNGQVWKVLKGSMRLRKPLVAPTVVVVPGIVGRWFLQVDEDLPKARVYRVD